jgi:PAS domain S-box-containing protein
LAIENSRLHEEVKVSRDNLDVMLKGIADGVSVQASDGSLVYVNDAAAHLCGFDSPAEMLSTPAKKIVSRFELFDEEGHPMTAADLPGRIALQGKECPSVLVRFRVKKTGVERISSIKATPVFAEDGKVKFAVNVFRDITSSKLAEEELRSSRERFRSVVESAPDFIFTVDRAGRIQFINRTLPGLPRQKVIGSSAFDYVSPDFRLIMKRAFKRVFRTGQTQSYEVEGAGASGTSWYQSSVSPIREKNGKISQLTVVSKQSEKFYAPRQIWKRESLSVLSSSRGPTKVYVGKFNTAARLRSTWKRKRARWK